MKRFLTTLIIPTASLAISLGAFGALYTAPAGAATPHVAMATTTWHGKVTKINETMGATHSFVFEGAHGKSYVVRYDTMTKFTMGMGKDVKVGDRVSVNGTLRGRTITAASIEL